jgi:Effector Associated Constant Component 1
MPEELKKQLVLTLGAGPDADGEELAELSRQLRSELVELGVETANAARSGKAPAGAKGDPITLTTLAVTLAPIALTGLVKALEAWLTRHDRATVTVESGGEKITISGSPSKEQERTLEAFISHHLQ